MKFCKAILAYIFITMMLCISTYAASTKDNKDLVFGNVIYSGNSAEVVVENNTTTNKPATFLVVCYDNQGKVTNVKSNKVTNIQGGGSATLRVEDIPSASKVVAYVMENLFSKSKMPMPAVKGTNSTDIAFIKLNGKVIEGFSNEKDKYIVPNTADFELEAVAKDNSTLVEIVKDSDLNMYEIKLKSHNGNLERTVTVSLYENAIDTLSIEKIIYETDSGIIGEITDVSQVMDWTLPKYTKWVKVTAVSNYSQNVEYYVHNDVTRAPDYYKKDLSYQSDDFKEQSYSEIDSSTAKNPFREIRPAKDQTIPIKNQESYAIIKVTGTDESGKETAREYKIRFTAEQPRITNFRLRNGAAEPVFVSGAAMFNDALRDEDGYAIGGSVISADRKQICVDMPEELIGASAFLFPASSNTSNSWYKNNSTGIYFSFKADTPGTIYIFAQNGFGNTSEYSSNGWISVSNMTLSMSNETTTFTKGYYKSFQSGELVDVYHPGKNSHTNDYRVATMIVWDECIISSLNSIEINVDKSKDVVSQLPDTVRATTTSGGEIDVEVTWNTDGYDFEGSSVHTIYGTVSEDDYVFADGVSNGVAATLNLVQNEITSVKEIETIYILQNESLDEKLPATVIAEVLVGDDVECDVVWDTTSFDDTQVGIVSITGEIIPPAGVENNGVETSVPVVVRYSDEHIIFALEESGMLKDEDMWVDLSQYGNDVELNIDNNTMKWTDEGLYIAAGQDNTVEITAEEVYEAIKSHEFTIEFETFEINTEADSELPFFTAELEYVKDENASEGNLILNYNTKNNRNYFKFAGGLSKNWTISSADVINRHKNVITVNDDKQVVWYVDGVERPAVTAFNNGDITNVTKFALMGDTKVTSSNQIGGSIVWKTFKIYNDVRVPTISTTEIE